MIIAEGYSKDPNIIPEGIVITFGAELIKMNTKEELLQWFTFIMNSDDQFWMHRCMTEPKYEIQYVYITMENKLWGRCNYGGFERNYSKPMYGNRTYIGWTGIVVSAPFEKCPFERELKGFRGFRYCTKLF